jgi:uncharacterized membrane protein YeaQ/YmgE (transglycosylase-associated protein family)
MKIIIVISEIAKKRLLRLRIVLGIVGAWVGATFLAHYCFSIGWGIFSWVFVLRG